MSNHPLDFFAEQMDMYVQFSTTIYPTTMSNYTKMFEFAQAAHVIVFRFAESAYKYLIQNEHENEVIDLQRLLNVDDRLLIKIGNCISNHSITVELLELLPTFTTKLNDANKES